MLPEQVCNSLANICCYIIVICNCRYFVIKIQVKPHQLFSSFTWRTSLWLYMNGAKKMGSGPYQSFLVPIASGIIVGECQDTTSIGMRWGYWRGLNRFFQNCLHCLYWSYKDFWFSDYLDTNTLIRWLLSYSCHHQLIKKPIPSTSPLSYPFHHDLLLYSCTANKFSSTLENVEYSYNWKDNDLIVMHSACRLEKMQAEGSSLLLPRKSTYYFISQFQSMLDHSWCNDFFWHIIGLHWTILWDYQLKFFISLPGWYE